MSNWKSIIEDKYPQETIVSMKKTFARLLVKYNRDMDTIFVDGEFAVMFMGDMASKLYAINHWVHDLEVMRLEVHFQNEGAIEALPNQYDIARTLLDEAKRSYNARDKALLLRQYSELMGFINKGKGESEQATPQSTQNVILITEHGNTQSWSEKLLNNQQNLQNMAEEALKDVDRK